MAIGTKYFAALVLMSVTGCCGVVSQRFREAPQGAMMSDGSEVEGCGDPAMAGDMHSSLLSLKHQFHAALEPEPPAFEPPRPRFHPVPTQPVFNARPEYAPPEPLAVVMPAAIEANLKGSPTVELLPTPAARPSVSAPVDQASALSREPNPLR